MNSSSPLGSLSSLCRRHRQQVTTLLSLHICSHWIYLLLWALFNIHPDKKKFGEFTSPVLCAFLLARACLLSLRSLAHRSVSLSPVPASTSGTMPDSSRLRTNQVLQWAPHRWALAHVEKSKVAMRTSPVRSSLRPWSASGLCEAQQVRLLQTGNTRPPAHFL